MDKEELLKIKRYKIWVDCYNSQLNEIEKLKKLALSFGSVGNIVNSLDEWKQAIIEKKRVFEKQKNFIVQAVEAIPDERYRTIIRLRYIEGKNWEQIPVLANFSYSHTLALHKQFWEKEGEINGC